MTPSSSRSDPGSSLRWRARTRAWAWAPLLIATTITGCLPAADRDAASPVTPSGADKAGVRRRPDGVAIDPVSAPPVPVDRASAADGLVTLRAPLGVEVARAVVIELLQRIAREDSEGMAGLFTRDALAIVPSSSNQAAQAKDWWDQRFRRLEYTKLAGEQVAREAEFEIYRAEDSPDLPSHAAIRTEGLGATDVVIRVPIITNRVGQDRLLGDEMVLWLRREGDQYRIYRILEDFQLQ